LGILLTEQSKAMTTTYGPDGVTILVATRNRDR
jgi:hypothetical protein